MTLATISSAADRKASTGDSSEHRFRFRSDSEAAPAARMAVYNLDPPIPAGLLTDLMLCVTELVTNSVQHPAVSSDDEVELCVRVFPGCVHVDVGDRGQGFDPERVRRERG